VDESTELTRALRSVLRHTDPASEPRRLVAGALLIEEVQRHQRAREWLLQRVRGYLAGDGNGWEPEATLAERAEQVLRAAGGPMNYRDIAAEIERRGFRHAQRPKRPNQLAESVWTALKSDPRFVKVARGVWDVAGTDSGNGLGELDVDRSASRITAARPGADVERAALRA
jgi:hypothetical protein